MFGGGEGIRTPDPMVANHVLCQLSYTPNKHFGFKISECGFENPKSEIAHSEILRLVAGAGFEPATFGL